jgi:hypothetical protein
LRKNSPAQQHSATFEVSQRHGSVGISIWWNSSDLFLESTIKTILYGGLGIPTILFGEQKSSKHPTSRERVNADLQGILAITC